MVLAVTSVIAIIIVIQTKCKNVSAIPTTVVWQTTSLDKVYSPKTATNDIVGDTLADMRKVREFLSNQIHSDTNLIRLLEREHQVSASPERLDSDLRKLRGVQLDFIGQLHESLDSSGYPIEKIQREIARIVRTNYDVLWTEDFTGGRLVTADTCWKELAAESDESDLPSVKAIQIQGEQVMKDYVKRSIPLHASFQLLFDPSSSIEVYGADYLPVKAIQQHLMEYKLTPELRGSPVPYKFQDDSEQKISSALSCVRNLYILRTIALHADRKKRNVLVLGRYHTNHMAYLMAHYGVQSTFMVPK